MIANVGLLILGFGGHARSVADVAVKLGVEVLLFVDEGARDQELFLGHRVQREYLGALPAGWLCIPAAGNNARRRGQIEHAEAEGWELATVVSPYACIGLGVALGIGTIVGNHAHVGPMATVGAGCIINTGAIVEHDCIIGDYTHVSVNATVAGRACLGRSVFLGAGAVVVDRVSVCDGTTVGAGAVVNRSIERPGVYVGVPARPLLGP